MRGAFGYRHSALLLVAALLRGGRRAFDAERRSASLLEMARSAGSPG
ncbi:hypothetical protein [Streptomyces sp. NPDC004629]